MDDGTYRDVGGLYVSRIFSEHNVLSAISYKPVPDDVFIVGYPKSGTTWMQNIVYNIYNDGVPTRHLEDFLLRSPFLESLGGESAAKMPRPGAIKTHLLCYMHAFSKQAKYIHIVRNPYDCCVSFYHHTKSIPAYRFENGSFDEFFEMFLSGKCDFGDYFDHLVSWWERRNDDNVLLVTYENLKGDTRSWILKIAEFLGDAYCDKLRRRPDILEAIVSATSVEGMKKFNSLFKKWSQCVIKLAGPKAYSMESCVADDLKKPMTGDFIRKGVVGDWRNHFTEDHTRRMKQRIALTMWGNQLMDLWKDVDLP